VKLAALRTLISSLAFFGAGLVLAGDKPAGHPTFEPIAAQAESLNLPTTGVVLPGAQLADDWAFFRRVWLDLAGALPPFEEARAFAADRDPDKRAKLVDRILQSEAYVDRWTAFFGELYRNFWLVDRARYRNAFHFLLRDMVAANRPYDEMTRELLTYSGQGGDARSAINFWAIENFEEEFRLDFLDDQVSAISTAMLGVQTECITCHDGAGHLEQINKGLSVMKRQQLWGMAALLSGTYFYLPPSAVDAWGDPDRFYRALQVVDLDQASFQTGDGELLEWDPRFIDGEYRASSEAGEGMRPARRGGVIAPRYLFTGETPRASETRRQALARMITADRQFARNLVNRLWQSLTGTAFVEPVDAWDLGRLDPETAAGFDAPVQPQNPALLESLTQAFIDADYDLKALFRTMTAHPYYQLDYALGAGAKIRPGLEGVARKRMRRLESETLVDVVNGILGLERAYFVEGVYDQAFHSAWSLPGAEEPSGWWLYDDSHGIQPRQYGYENWDELFFIQWATQEFLQRLGRPNREQREARREDMTLPRSLVLMNNELFNSGLLAWGGGSPLTDGLAEDWKRGVRDTSETVRALIRRVLYREPTPAELALFLGHFDPDRPEWSLGDMAWALFNHPDFLHR